jgi:predicted transposase YbfD/YdcC
MLHLPLMRTRRAFRYFWPTRMVEVFSAVRTVATTEWKSLVKDVVRVSRNVLHRNARTRLWRSSSEIACYVANCPTAARHAVVAIRGYWHIENKLHATCDVIFQEDQSRIRHNPGLFARLRCFLYNILRRNRTSTLGQDRYVAALGGLGTLLKWSSS